MSLQHCILHLSLIEKIGPSHMRSFIEQLGIHRLHEIYSFSSADFQSFGFCEQKSQDIVAGLHNKALLQRELDLMLKFHVGMVTFLCPDYPALLKEIHVLPLVLYYQGDVALFAHTKNIACVGSRKAHRYVYEALMHIVVPMMHDGWVVVSGGALGADSFAHQISLDQGSPTIVVVGSGLCHQYPPQNKKLFENVVARGGLIVSSFAMDTPPEPWCFPARNRLISGLSRGCLVLQAAAKSGALITADCALEQGREVFALPGSIFDPLSAGCNSLIQQGAKLVTCAQDLLQELEGDALEHSVKPKSTSVQQKLFHPAQVEPIDQVIQQILDATVVSVTADMLISKLEIDMQTLQDKLFELSLDGKIAQDAMGFWKRL